MTSRRIQTYSPASKFFHWMVAFLVLVMLCAGFLLSYVPEAYRSAAYTTHKSIGLTILALMLMRLVWILKSGKPPLPDSVPKWQKRAAHIVQYSLYFFLIMMPLSGWIMSTAANRAPYYFGLIKISFPGIPHSKPLAEFFNETHTVFAWIIITLLILHIAAALKHHFIDKDDVLNRMLPQKFQKP